VEEVVTMRQKVRGSCWWVSGIVVGALLAGGAGSAAGEGGGPAGRPGAGPGPGSQTRPAGEAAVPQTRPAGAPAGPDAKAAAVADEVLKAGGGAEGLASARYLRFSFVVEKEGKVLVSRTHYWDRVKDRHRLEMMDKGGNAVTCLSHLPTQEGICTVGDKVLMEQEAAPHLARAHAVWINDTYWLLMPYKMKDPGVRLTYEGEVKEGGAVYDKVALAFEKVGLTPADRYWAFVDRKTRRMTRWAYVLQDEKGQPGSGEPESWDWKGWARHGPIWLSPERVSRDGKTRILFKDLAVFDELPDSVFSKTAKVEATRPSAPGGR
jgi:hypothetical protein